MHEVEYIVVGLGIAGLTFCERLSKHNKKFLIFDHSKNVSTLTSAGIINPTVLKRFTRVWNAEEHLKEASSFYQRLSDKLNKPFFTQIPLFRLINNVEEQNNWIVASDKIEMEPFLSPKILKNDNPFINAPHGYGKVLGTGRVDTFEMIKAYKEHLYQNHQLIDETFEYQTLTEKDGNFIYKNISSKYIVFSEGPAGINNPFFQRDLLIGSKGEYLILKVPELNLKVMIKASVFIIPLGNDLYKVGATYSHEDYTCKPTQRARKELTEKLSKLIQCPFEIVDHIAGIRPTTKDRRPLLGSFPHSTNMYFFNGLGTRGIIAAPSLSNQLFQYIENGIELSSEIDIRRNLN